MSGSRNVSERLSYIYYTSINNKQRINLNKIDKSMKVNIKVIYVIIITSPIGSPTSQ